MRLDAYLRNTGLIPSRSVAKQACDRGLVQLNGRQAKAAAEVRVGDRIVLRVGMKVTEHEVLQLPERPVPRPERELYARLVSSQRLELEL